MDSSAFIALLVVVLLTQMAACICLKHLSCFEEKTTLIFWKFAVSATTSGIFIICFGEPSDVPAILLFALPVMGAMNVLANWLNYQAVEASQSQTASYGALHDVATIAIAIVVLGEWQALSPVVTAALIMTLIASYLFSVQSSKDSARQASPRRSVFLLVLATSILWGIVPTVMRLVASEGVTPAVWVFLYHGSASFSALALLQLKGRQLIMPKAALVPATIMGWLILANMALFFYLLAHFEVVIVQPGVRLAGLFSALFVSLFLFGERKQYSAKSYPALVLGCCAAVVMALWGN